MSTDPTPPAAKPGYEFTPAEGQVFASLAGNLHFIGWAAVVAVVVFHAVLIARWAVDGVPMYDKFRGIYVVWPVFVLLASGGFITTARAFRRVAGTEGNDIAHLMDGLTRLDATFDWLALVPKAWAVLVLFGLAIGLTLAAAHWLGY